jgi:hypothetical protein
MRALAVVLSLTFATSVFGQAVHRNFGSVVFPGGTTSPSTGITRNFGSVVFPGGTQSQPVFGGAPAVNLRPGVGRATQIPVGTIQHQNIRRPTGNGIGNGNGFGRGNRSVTPYVYAYPVYIGGGYDNSFAPQESYGPEPPPQQQPNITVIYPPQQHARPVMIQPGPDGEYNTNVRPPATVYETPRPGNSVSEPEPAESNRYLLAFKDHTIYSAVAYWVDGDTLHYFTTGNTHNQASLSLIDRELTERLNRELGIDFKLPASK